MIAKRVRRWVCCVAIGAFAFAQIVSAVHACPVPAASAVGATRTAATHPGHEQRTDTESAPAGEQGTPCEPHCADGVVASAQSDSQAAAFTALRAPALAVAEVRANFRASSGAAGEALVAVSRAPPVAFQFRRLLN